MPTYDYKCNNCQTLQEVFIPMKDANQFYEGQCINCKCKRFLEKQFSGTTAIAFKGSGFYVNDYCSKGKTSE